MEQYAGMDILPGGSDKVAFDSLAVNVKLQNQESERSGKHRTNGPLNWIVVLPDWPLTGRRNP